jgi:NADH-quinone oxidoreductase subunit N
MNYLDLARLVFPEILLVLTALVVLGIDLKLRAALRPPQRRRAWATGTAIAGCLVAAAWLVIAAPEGTLPGGMFASDPVTRLVKVLLLGLTAGTFLLSAHIEFTPHLGEYVAVVLFGATGMMLIASSENVMMMFLALELASLSLYILTGFDKRRGDAAEAALKYFLFGGMAGAFLLFGLSVIYGVTGAVEFNLIRASLGTLPMSPLLLTGFVMVFVGLGFKVAAAPFQFWAPDAYEGAPTPAASFIATGSKVAAFFILAKFTTVALSAAAGGTDWGRLTTGWSPLLAVIASASMIWGNLAALSQRNVKRLLAYSAVAHAGYTLTAIVGRGEQAISAVTFYAATYAFTILGAFGAIGIVEKLAGGSDFHHFSGLSRRAPVVALSLAIFLLSLAGIPPLVGFFGKFYLFIVALQGENPGLGLLWLVGLGAATTCISFYYYLRVLKAMFVEDLPEQVSSSASDRLELATVVVAALLVVAVGCIPALLLSPLQSAIVAAGP